MTVTAIRTFDKALESATKWVEEIRQDLHYNDRQEAYVALRAVLRTLRDRLTIEEATDFASQLPLLIKGVYYDGWNPTGKPVRLRSTEEFIDYVDEKLRDDMDPYFATQQVFKFLRRHVTPSEIQHVIAELPNDLKELWKE